MEGDITCWVFSAGTIITYPHLHHHPSATFLSSQAASSLQLLSTHHSRAPLENNALLSERNGHFPKAFNGLPAADRMHVAVLTRHV